LLETISDLSIKASKLYAVGLDDDNNGIVAVFEFGSRLI